MRSKLLTVLLLLLLPAWGVAQNVITVGDAIPQSDVEAAKTTLDKAKSKLLTLNTGEFEIIEPAKGLVSPLLWIPSNPTVAAHISVAANQPLAFYGTRKGDTGKKLYQFPAKPVAWVVVIGLSSGSMDFKIVKNGDDAKGIPPAIIDTVTTTVDGAPDDPVVPPTDDLTAALKKAYQLDVQAGKADKKWCEALAKIYTSAAADSLDVVKTAGDLDALLDAARQTAGIPAAVDMLYNVRMLLRQEMLSKLSVPENGDKIPLGVDAKRAAKQLFTKFAKSLRAV